MFSRLIIGLLISMVAVPTFAATVTIDSFTFELDQFTGATVTYRDEAGSSVTFDGKLWDNEVGVDMATLGELASGQFGSDPGDQISLNSTPDPDWLQLNYAGPGLTIGAGEDTFVVYEITSSNAGVDVEGTSWRISFNGGAFIDASAGTATFLPFPASENVNQISFDLTSFGFSNGDLLTTVRIENKDSGSGTSDPDFIFAALETPPAAVPMAGVWGLAALGVLLLGLIARRRDSTRSVRAV